MDPACFSFKKLEEKPWFEFVSSPISIGFDPSLFSSSNVEIRTSYFKDKNIEFIPIEENLIDTIWENKPERPKLGIFELEKEFYGESIFEKMEKLKKELLKKG